MRRSPELQCESGQPALGSSRPRLRTPASAGHPAHSSSGRDTQADKAIRLWVAATGRALGAPLTGHDGAVLSVAFCPHRIQVVSAGDDDTVRSWDTVTVRPIGTPVPLERGGQARQLIGLDAGRALMTDSAGTVQPG